MCDINDCAILYVSVNKPQQNLYDKYKEVVKSHNEKIMNNMFPDSGFDLYVPETTSIDTIKTQFVSMEIKCEMRLYNRTSMTWNPTGYYMYPRSSISKTPLMLANSVGIIDSGYRGNIIGAFRNIVGHENAFTVEKHTRLLQICAPDLRPIVVKLVEETFFEQTERGDGGFGSTDLGLDFWECQK